MRCDMVLPPPPPPPLLPQDSQLARKTGRADMTVSRVGSQDFENESDVSRHNPDGGFYTQEGETDMLPS